MDQGANAILAAFGPLQHLVDRGPVAEPDRRAGYTRFRVPAQMMVGQSDEFGTQKSDAGETKKPWLPRDFATPGVGSSCTVDNHFDNH
jgi:hypothetical protein